MSIAPRRPPGLAGFFLEESFMPPLEVHLFVDYQNVHITAHEQFGTPGTPLYLSLIHPVRLADAIDAERAAHNRPGVITQVHVFRGLPSAGYEPDSYRRNLAQTAEWQKDRRVIVHSRSLRYPRDWPDSKAREKGVDVMLGAGFTPAPQSHRVIDQASGRCRNRSRAVVPKATQAS